MTKQARHLKKAREIEAQKLNMKRNDKKRKIDEIINKMDEQKLDNTLDLITKLTESSKERINLISSVQELSEEEVPTANHLIKTMRYPKGPNEGKLISLYLQNKAYEYMSQSLYKRQFSVSNSLQEINNAMETKIKQLQRQNDNLINK